ncbi:MAG TPA: O-antigen ligase family protein [Polyangia bacterium]|nr:O-antigen ligase family protein [Polyangia bacterium]
MTLTCAVVAAAPLAVGGVHRIPILLLVLVSGLGLACLVMGSALERRPVRIGFVSVLPFVLLAIPFLQSLPLPLAVRGVFDPAGNALILGSDLPAPRLWPLSLDPVLTRERVAEAAAALAVFLVAFHIASGSNRRHLMYRLVGLTGVAAVVIGLGHRIFGVHEIYGHFVTTNRSVLVGPFVDSNHTAEFLELAAFACLACSFQRRTALNRYGWLTGMLLCAGGAVGTLSRGSVLAIVAGMLLFTALLYRMRDESAEAKRGVAIGWGVIVSVLIIGMATFMGGAGALVERFRGESASGDLRFQLWRDSLHVLGAHPFGIGRGAFERVYPVYRTLRSSFPITFAFVECHPLQLLIDCGWPFFAAIVVTVGLVVRWIVVHSRRDKIESALLAGLFAVTVHSAVDFGLETLGVLLPFAALLGTTLGRMRPANAPEPSPRTAWIFAAIVGAAALFGVVSVAHSSDDDFDTRLKQPQSLAQRRALLLRAEAVHPTDYFYALAYAATEPLQFGGGRGRSPRLHALNRALELCPNCELVHLDVARSLWQLGSHRQALVEWRTAVQLQPALFPGVVDELWRLKASGRELAAVASFDASKMVDTANFLAEHASLADARIVLDQADLMGASRAESLLLRCKLQIESKDVDAARTTLAEARAAGIQDPRLALLDAQIILTTKGRAGVDEAFAVLDAAAMRYPLDLPVQRMRVAMVSDYGKWQASDRALDGLKLALYHSNGSGVEANLAAARIRARLSQWSAAMSEYRIALMQQPSAGIWFELGQAAEHAGRDSTAREAYSEAARLEPGVKQYADALRQFDARMNDLRTAGVARSPVEEPRVP